MDSSGKSNDEKVVKIKIVYDNFTHIADLETNWGYAAVVETNSSTFLFDTGAHGDILLHNMETIGVKPEDIDFVVISHSHPDHTGGLHDFLARNSNLKVYHPKSFPEQIINEIKEFGAEPISISSATEIVPDVFSSGEIDGKVPEQALVIKTDEGNVLMTGCAHPGIIKMIEAVKAEFKDESIYLALGGFHLYKCRLDEIRSVVDKFKELGIQRVAPSHCSGSPVRDCFKRVYGDDFVEVGIGSVVGVNS